MGTSLADLRFALNIEVGGDQGDPELDILLEAGVDLYNVYAVQQFAVDDGELDRDASALERRALVLYGLLAFLNREVIKASRNAVKISNPAGSTDLSSIEWALGKRRKELLEGPLQMIINLITSSGIVTEVHAEELGETRPLSTTSGRYPYFQGW